MKPWTTATLANVGRWLSGGTPSKQNRSLWDGAVPWVSPKDMKRSRISDAIDHVSHAAVGNGTQFAPAGSLLLVVRGMILAHSFPVALATAPVTFNQDIKALVPEETWCPEFLLYWLQNSAADVLRLVDVANHGTKRLPSERLFDVRVPQPPLDEQRRIAAVLSSVDDTIDATQAVVEQLQIVKKATMAELLTRGMPRRHTRFKQTPIGELPEAWEVRPLKEIARIFNGKAAGTGGTWLRVFKTKHVYDGMLRLDKVEFARDDVASKVKADTHLQTGDVLTPNMAHGTIGRLAFVPAAQGNWTVDGQVMVIRAQQGASLGRFLFESMSLPRGRQRLLDLEKGGAFDTLRGQTHIYPRDVGEIEIAVPSLEEQQHIAAVASAFDEPVSMNKSCLEELVRVKHGLMDRLLSGELRVPPDRRRA